MTSTKPTAKIAKALTAYMASLVLAGSATAADATTTPELNATGDRPTQAQSELIQGVNERRHEAAIEKADSEHQAEMKKCEGLVWEEEKLCKDQVSKETAQTQAKAEKDREKTTPAE
jgi:hypothetical protein